MGTGKMKYFLDIYQELNCDNLHLLKNIYREDVQFIDPAHEIHGLEKLTTYFRALYASVDSIRFSFQHNMTAGDDGYVQWRMTFSHQRLAGGSPIKVDGASFLRFADDDRIYFHRDYFDLGAMLYEHIPLLGRLTTSLKKRLGA